MLESASVLEVKFDKLTAEMVRAMQKEEWNVQSLTKRADDLS